MIKNNILKLASLVAVFLITANVHAVPILFQGSSVLSGTVTQSPAQARAAWEAQLQSFGIDTLAGASGGSPFTSTFGNTYSNSGNGSTITSNGSNIQGLRNGQSLIEFDVLFPNPVNAVGFDVFDNDGGGMRLELTDAISGALTIFDFTSVAGSGRTEFFGVIFEPTTFISALRVGGTDPGGVTSWDNFTTGVGENAVIPPSEGEVSVPSTFALFALGIFGFAARRFKSKS